MESCINEEMSYLPIDIFENPDQILDLLADDSQVWNLCDGVPPIICDRSKVYVDTGSDTDYINNLPIPVPSEHEYWHDPATIRLVYQGILDESTDAGVTPKGLSEIINPIVPRVRTPTAMDFDTKRPYFAHLPAEVIRNTFK